MAKRHIGKTNKIVAGFSPAAEMGLREDLHFRVTSIKADVEDESGVVGGLPRALRNQDAAKRAVLKGGAWLVDSA